MQWIRKKRETLKIRRKIANPNAFLRTGQKMFEMMNKFCWGGFPDCSSMMKAMGNQDCCKPKKEETDHKGGKK